MAYITTLIILFFCTPSFAAHAYKESIYQSTWCKQRGGIIEYKLPDKSRVDCLTSTHAIEFDFARKWPEAVGQSLYYAAQTGKQPGIVLIMESDKDVKYLLRSLLVIFPLDIALWVMVPDEIR